MPLLEALKEALSQDPRPSYIEDKDRVYGFYFDRFEVKFTVDGKDLFVIEIIER